MRLLFITSNRLGDAVLSTGLLGHALDRAPAARATIVCGPAAAGVFERLPQLERLIVMEKARGRTHWWHLWRAVAGTHWDQVIDLRGSGMPFLLRARARAWSRGGRRAEHRLISIARALALDAPPLPRCWTAPPDEARAAALLGDGAPIIGLGPTANWDGKIWPSDRFAALGETLAARLGGARIAVFGGPGAAERQRAAPLLAALPNPVDLVGGLSVSEASASLRRCVVFVGNDSGLMHLAAAAGTATLGLFGPSSPLEYAPAGRATAVATSGGGLGSGSIASLGVATALDAAWSLIQRDLAVNITST